MTRPPVLRAQGALEALDAATRNLLMNRGGDRNTEVAERTREIIQRVRQNGDDALRELSQQFDGARLDELEIPRQQWEDALRELAPDLRAAMERSARNIATVHRAFLPQAAEVSPEHGIVVGRRPDALNRVGVYAPGGRAAYPSSLFMGAIPARVAGVKEIVVCSPPSSNGRPSPVVLAAAAIAGVDRVFAVGGAGAIAAMAFGTASIPRVDRIVGPGNAYVAEAKLQVVGSVAIDSPAGPSELLVIADDEADAGAIVRELLAQAEHDPDAAVMAIIVGDKRESLADRVVAGLHAHVHGVLPSLSGAVPRTEIVKGALGARGAVLTAQSMNAAIAFANDWAAEHLLLAVGEGVQDDVLSRLRCAGTVFLGDASSVAFGDYMTGANHVLPTAGLARCYSGLSTLDFVRWTTWQRVSPQAASRLANDVAVFASAEGLPAHAEAARSFAVSVSPVSLDGSEPAPFLNTSPITTS